MKRIATFLALLSLVAIAAVALPPFIGNEGGSLSGAPTVAIHYFYWEPTNELVSIMTRAWADTPSGDTIDVSGGTSATPTGQGFTDYQSLTNAGNSVTINP